MYSCGLYLDKLQAVFALKKRAAKGDDELLEVLAGGKFPKSLVLRMARNVDNKTFVDALAQSVAPRVQGSKACVTEFESVLAKGLTDGAKKDSVFCFESQSGNSKLKVSINGKVQGSINSPTLCR